jgi:hypothetical protein
LLSFPGWIEDDRLQGMAQSEAWRRPDAGNLGFFGLSEENKPMMRRFCLQPKDALYISIKPFD